ncbi:VPS4-associated protein 1 [Scheffersomyces amazonensis]|uniref:VPS4-associated protein 1 n=1 Tax=Scheffersomyces amazonensis TaxID=1078765 RepID=UPI00315D1D24
MKTVLGQSNNLKIDSLYSKKNMSKPGAPPFPNHYTVKLVAANDSKACTICYKPTPTVLLNDNKLDFLYICASHLKDDNFAVHLPNQEYDKLIEVKNGLDKKIETLKEQAELVKPYMINKLMTDYLPGFGKKDKDGNDKDKEVKIPKTNDEKYNAFQTQIQESTTKLVETNEQISNFKFKTYKLNQDIYRSRIINYNKVLAARARSQRIQSDPSFFPTAPSNSIG